MLLKLDFKPARIQDFGDPTGKRGLRIRCTPAEETVVEESDVLKLFKPVDQGGCPLIRHYRESGELLITEVESRREWMPEGAEAAPKGSDVVSTSGPAPQPVGAPKPPTPPVDDDAVTETAEKIDPEQHRLGGGVPGQGVREAVKNVRACEDAAQLEKWLKVETRTSVVDAIGARQRKLAKDAAAKDTAKKE